MASRMKALYNQIVFERRVLLGCTILVGLSICIWITAISTTHWFTIEAPNSEKGLPFKDIANGGNIPGTMLILRHQGLWRGCYKLLVPRNSTSGNNKTMAEQYQCRRIEMFSYDVDETVQSYARTEVSFALISLFVMVMGFSFSIYTFRNPRYMFKRLAGGIHFISGACSMVVIQVILSSVDFERKTLPESFPNTAILRYDYSLILGWLVCLINLLAACSFIIFSKKRKRDKAPNEEIAMADEPTIIGR